MFKCKTTILTTIATFFLLFSISSLANRIYSADNDLDVQEFTEGVLNGVIEPNTTMDNGTTALFAPAAAGNVDMVKKLLERGVNPNKIDDNGATALAYAAPARSMQEAQKAAEVDQEPLTEWAKKIFATGGRHMEVVDLLLQKDPAIDAMGLALGLAEARGQRTIAEKILIPFKRKLNMLPQDQLSIMLDQFNALTQDNPEFVETIRKALNNKEEL